ncbi:MAG TPA: hypothetical protein VI298_01645 [Geobacteraceae bacterium]
MNIKRFLAACLMIPLACAAIAAEKAPPTPDPELLEFLGTFETAGGREVDPFLLEKGPDTPAPPNAKGKRKPAPRKAAQEKTPPNGREQRDE